MAWDGPILDNHLHLDDTNGRGLAAVDEFVDAGGTHMILINKPSWWHDVEAETRSDFEVGFESICDITSRAKDRLPGTAWAILGVHPALLTRLTDTRGMDIDSATSLVTAGIDLAAEYVKNGDALGLKTGRPHYSVTDEIWEASNAIIRHALMRANECGCPVQLHTESGRDFSDIGRWADEAGIGRDHVVKHYADGPITGAVPSVISRKDAIEEAVESGDDFLMETDYLDDPSRPGAVLGPKTVPRRVSWLAKNGEFDALRTAHVTTPARVYGIDTEASHEA